ncbi:hypothetical protein D3C72_1896760 [compost metagenome]
MDQADLHHHQRKDAKPDRFVGLAHAEEIQAHDHRVEDRNGQQDHRQRIHDAAQHQIQTEDDQQHQHRCQTTANYPGREFTGHLRQGQPRVEQVGAEQYEEDHRRGFCRTQHARAKAAPAHPTLPHRENAAGRSANRGSLGRVGPTTVNADDHHQEHTNHR